MSGGTTASSSATVSGDASACPTTELSFESGGPSIASATSAVGGSTSPRWRPSELGARASSEPCDHTDMLRSESMLRDSRAAYGMSRSTDPRSAGRPDMMVEMRST